MQVDIRLGANNTDSLQTFTTEHCSLLAYVVFQNATSLHTGEGLHKRKKYSMSGRLLWFKEYVIIFLLRKTCMFIKCTVARYFLEAQIYGCSFIISPPFLKLFRCAFNLTKYRVSSLLIIVPRHSKGLLYLSALYPCTSYPSY